MLARRCSDEFKGTCDVDFSIEVGQWIYVCDQYNFLLIITFSGESKEEDLREHRV